MAKRWKLLLLLFVGTVALDQVTKFLAVAELTRAFEVQQAQSIGEKLQVFFDGGGLERIRTRPVAVIAEHWHFKYVENPGAAWGMLGGLEEGLRLPFFYASTALAIGFLLLFYWRLPENQRLLQVAIALVVGGAVGNFIDRVSRGYVIDFVDWHWKNQPNLHWPTFNVADVWICVGVALLLSKSLFARSPVAAAPHPAEDGPLPLAPEPSETVE